MCARGVKGAPLSGNPLYSIYITILLDYIEIEIQTQICKCVVTNSGKLHTHLLTDVPLGSGLGRGWSFHYLLHTFLCGLVSLLVSF